MGKDWKEVLWRRRQRESRKTGKGHKGEWMERREKAIDRFIDAQKETHATAKREISIGRKKSHWMWYTFPQIIGLGYTEISKYYSIQNTEELRQFVRNKYLCKNLLELFNILLMLEKTDAYDIFGEVDTEKFRSCLTLFNHTKRFHLITSKLLDKYFLGFRDDKTDVIYEEMKHGSHRKKFIDSESKHYTTTKSTNKLQKRWT